MKTVISLTWALKCRDERKREKNRGEQRNRGEALEE
jgi:hypothetical protein